jgi:hypothetical protein
VVVNAAKIVVRRAQKLSWLQKTGETGITPGSARERLSGRFLACAKTYDDAFEVKPLLFQSGGDQIQAFLAALMVSRIRSVVGVRSRPPLLKVWDYLLHKIPRRIMIRFDRRLSLISTAEEVDDDRYRRSMF